MLLNVFDPKPAHNKYCHNKNATKYSCDNRVSSIGLLILMKQFR